MVRLEFQTETLPNRFVVNVTPTDAVRTDIDRTPIDRIFLEKTNTLNIALTVYEDEAASEAVAAINDGE